MKLMLLIAGFISLGIAIPNGDPIGSTSDLYIRKENEVTCNDCKAKYDFCVDTAGVRNVNGGGCEKICAKRACQLNAICKGCDNDFLNCTGLNRYPAPTIVVPEKPEDKQKEEEERKKKEEEDKKKKEEEDRKNKEEEERQEEEDRKEEEKEREEEENRKKQENEDRKKKEDEDRKKKEKDDKKKKEEEEKEKQHPPPDMEDQPKHKLTNDQDHYNIGRSVNFLKYVYGEDGRLTPVSE